MCGTPWYDEHDGHADVGHHREHHDIADVIADGGSRGGSGLRAEPSKQHSQLHASYARAPVSGTNTTILAYRVEPG